LPCDVLIVKPKTRVRSALTAKTRRFAARARRVGELPMAMRTQAQEAEQAGRMVSL
jgi:hypothetical protein